MGKRGLVLWGEDGFSQGQLSPRGNLMMLHVSPRLEQGEPPASVLQSGQVDLYLGTFTLDCKAQFVLCNTVLVISLGFSLCLVSYTSSCCKKLSINSLEKIQARNRPSQVVFIMI